MLCGSYGPEIEVWMVRCHEMKQNSKSGGFVIACTYSTPTGAVHFLLTQ